MNPLSEVLRSNRSNHGRGIQKALRKIDVHVLALSILNLDEDEREILYRNTTKRVVRMLEKELDIISFNLKNNDAGPFADESGIADAQELVAQTIIKWTNEKADTPVTYPGELPEVNLDSFDDILKTFVGINDHARKYGIFSINGIENKTNNVLFKRGIELMVDGIDPLILDEIMENYVKSLSNKYIRELNLIRNAIKLIQIGSTSDAIIDMLKSLENA